VSSAGASIPGALHRAHGRSPRRLLQPRPRRARRACWQSRRLPQVQLKLVLLQTQLRRRPFWLHRPAVTSPGMGAEPAAASPSTVATSPLVRAAVAYAAPGTNATTPWLRPAAAPPSMGAEPAAVSQSKASAPPLVQAATACAAPWRPGTSCAAPSAWRGPSARGLRGGRR